MTVQRIVGFFIVLLLVFAVGYLIWSVGYQGEDYEELNPTEVSAEVTIVGVGEEFKVRLPKADNPDQVWILVKETLRIEKVNIDRSGEEEVWTFRALKVGHSPLEFSWSLLERGVWPSDERRIIEIEIR